MVSTEREKEMNALLQNCGFKKTKNFNFNQTSYGPILWQYTFPLTMYLQSELDEFANNAIQQRTMFFTILSASCAVQSM